MKVTITDTSIHVDGAPAMNPVLGDDDALLISYLQALVWTIGRIEHAVKVATEVHASKASVEVQTAQVLERMRLGRH